MCRVLREPAETDLQQTELALDLPKRMLDFRAHAGLTVLLLLHSRIGSAFGHLGDVTGPRRDVPVEVFSIDPARGTASRAIRVGRRVRNLPARFSARGAGNR